MTNVGRPKGKIKYDNDAVEACDRYKKILPRNEDGRFVGNKFFCYKSMEGYTL